MLALLLAAALATTLAVVAAKSSKPKGDDGKGVEPKGEDPSPSLEPQAQGLAAVRHTAASMGAPLEWQDFFVLVAAGESGFHSDVGLGSQLNAPLWVDMNTSAAEAKAALRAFDRNADEYDGCWPREAYGFGSGGWFGLLPANGIIAFKGSELRCLHPWTVFDPKISTIMAAWFARRLTGWSNWDGTVLSLRIGWGTPENMGDPAIRELKRDKFVQHCAKAGLPSSFLDVMLPDWKPAQAVQLFNELGGDRGWLPAS